MKNGIHLSRDGHTYGPYTENQIRGMIASGHASPDDDAWEEGMADWKPLRSLIAISTPPSARPTDEVILQEPGVLVSRSKIQIGSSIFAPDRIGGVSITVESRRKVFPVIGLIFFGMMTLGGMAGILSSKDKGTPIIMTFFILLPITLWCAHRCFAPLKLTLMVAASGGMQSALIGTDRNRMNRIAEAIQKAILTLVVLLAFLTPSLNAQEASGKPEELHLLVAKVEERGILADAMRPQENETVTIMKITGNPLASGMVPAGVSSKGLAAAMELVWKPSGKLVFVKGNFSGSAEGDIKVVKAVRQGSCKIHSQSDGEERTIALYQAEE